MPPDKDVAVSGSADDTATDLWDCIGAANQQWTLTAGLLVNPQSDAAVP